MKKNLSLLALMSFLTFGVVAQVHLPAYNEKLIHPDLMKNWTANWISCPDENLSEYGVYHFRKVLELDETPKQYVVHVSADNRYKLYVNEQLVSLGPSRCDLKNWNYETVDLAPYLHAGKNILAAVVWQFAGNAPVAQMSSGQMQFMLQGNTEAEKPVNTDNSWKVLRDHAYTPYTKSTARGYYAAGAGEEVDASQYPWGWEKLDFDDSEWVNARRGMRGAPKGGRDTYGLPLVPSAIPPQSLKQERLSEVRLSDGMEVPANFLKQPVNFIVPANTEVRLILDNKVLTTGYSTLLYGGGRGAEIKIGYAESLYDTSHRPVSKGNRNEVEGKTFYGYYDLIHPDGGADRNFTSLWWRTWRYIELTITTKDEPLVLNDLYGTFTAYPFEVVSTFNAPERPEYAKVLELGWRTAQLCAHETYMDCPYYEQLQYFGDSRIQTMVTMYNTADKYMVKRALEFGRESMQADGITLSRYPDSLGQVITSYALSWIGMCYDYWMYRGDDSYLKTLLPAMRSVIGWYEGFLKDDYSLERIPFWYFCDWADGFQSGEPVREDGGNSAIQDLDFLQAVEELMQMEQAFGIKEMGEHYRQLSEGIRQGFRAKYWDSGRQMFADTHDHRGFSQHANARAILAGLVQGEEAGRLFQRIMTEKGLVQCTIYYRYYLQMAMDRAGCGNMLQDNLGVFTENINLGLSTMMEQPEPSRSDCHAWSASMNIEFYRMILGIRSGAPGYQQVVISPSLGSLTKVSGSVPHPAGVISAAYQVGNKQVEATLTLPQGIIGTFIWKGKMYELKPGKQTLKLDK